MIWIYFDSVKRMIFVFPEITGKWAENQSETALLAAIECIFFNFFIQLPFAHSSAGMAF
jgi:hypothetical protein